MLMKAAEFFERTEDALNCGNFCDHEIPLVNGKVPLDVPVRVF
jgi:hypothetical protein